MIVAQFARNARLTDLVMTLDTLEAMFDCTLLAQSGRMRRAVVAANAFVGTAIGSTSWTQITFNCFHDQDAAAMIGSIQSFDHVFVQCLQVTNIWSNRNRTKLKNTKLFTNTRSKNAMAIAQGGGTSPSTSHVVVHPSGTSRPLPSSTVNVLSFLLCV